MQFDTSNTNESSHTSSNNSSSKHAKQPEKHKSQKSTDYTKREKTSKEAFATACRGCGSNRHLSADCPFKGTHPDYNPDRAIVWEDTKQYRTLNERTKGKFTWLANQYRIDGTKLDDKAQPEYSDAF